MKNFNIPFRLFGSIVAMLCVGCSETANEDAKNNTLKNEVIDAPLTLSEAPKEEPLKTVSDTPSSTELNPTSQDAPPAEPQPVTDTPKSNNGSRQTLTPPINKGLHTYLFTSEIGTQSYVTILEKRIGPSGHGIATLQSKSLHGTSLWDTAFICAARKYVYLHNNHNAAPVTPEKIADLHYYSDKQLTAYDRGEALQRLRYSPVDELPSPDRENMIKAMDIACNP